MILVFDFLKSHKIPIRAGRDPPTMEARQQMRNFQGT
jgi:hypothetical protein